MTDTLGLATTRAINRSGGHLYTLVEQDRELGPFPGATALTGLHDALGGSDGLMGWAVNLALDEVDRWVHGGFHGEFHDVRSRAFAAKNKARDLGSAIHEQCDRINRGQTFLTTGESAPYVAQYGAALYQKGINVLASERYVVNTDIGFGGTYDSLVEIDGERGPLDVKTGKAKPSQRLQLAALSMGQWHGEAGMEAEPMPELDPVGWILLLRPDGYELVRHDITEFDKGHVQALVHTYHAIRAWNAYTEQRGTE